MPADVLVIDAGSSGLRCTVVRGTTVIAAARRPLEHHSPPDAAPFGREFDLGHVWSLTLDACREALALARVRPAAVAVVAQREAMVFLDRAGEALYGGPNIDLRAIGEGASIDAEQGAAVYDTTGRLPSLLFAPARLAWFRRHRPDTFERIGGVLSLSGWLNSRLTGERALERPMAAELGLLDVHTGEYAAGLLQRLGVPRSVLPPLVEPATCAGKVRARVAEELGLPASTPVIAAGPDTQCGLVGQGATLAGAGAVGGWSCPVAVITDAPRVDPARRTWTAPHAVPGRWIVESNAMDAGRAWDWWVHLLVGGRPGAAEGGAALAEAAPAGAAGVLSLSGPRAMDASRTGVRHGGLLLRTPLPAEPDRGTVLRAVLENIAYAVRANLEQADRVAGVASPSLAFGGGLSRIDSLCRMLASVVARPLRRCSPDSTALGTAVLAAVGLGLRRFEAEGVEATVIEPDAALAALYEDGYRQWQEADRRLNEET